MCTKWRDEPELRIAELKQCYVTLNRDQFFPGYCFVFSKSHVTELFHLDAEIRAAVMAEVSLVAATLDTIFRADKINYELLGNMVPHMHWHLVPRSVADPLWPRPIWSEPHEPVILSAKEYAERVGLIRALLAPAKESR